MVNQEHWYKPVVIMRIRTSITIILYLIATVMLYINHIWLIKLFKQIVSSI